MNQDDFEWPRESSAALATRIRFINRALRPSQKKNILDIGCGTGELLTQHLASLFPEAKVYGVDEDAVSINYANKRFAGRPNLDFSTKIPENISFDAIVASEVLEHVNEPASFLSFCYRSLTPDGLFVVTVPNGYGWSEIMAMLEDVLVVTGILPLLRRFKQFVTGSRPKEGSVSGDTLSLSPHINFFSYRRIRSLLENNGFHIRQYRGRMVFHNFLFSMVLDRSEALSRGNAWLARFLPPFMVSDWMFVADRAVPMIADNKTYDRNHYEVFRSRLRGFRNKIERNSRERPLDFSQCTYGSQVPRGELARIFPPLPLDALRPKAEEIRGVVGKFSQHHFDLLGSGWTEVKLGMGCRGFEGHVYTSKPGALTERINAANLEESKRISERLDKNYQPIDWQLDFKSGYRWSERTWYRDIRYGDKIGADIKVPWELSRMQHLIQFCWAYSLSAAGEPGFARPSVYQNEFQNQILDFISANPPRFGVNWACTMDVAIRISNWLVAYDLFRAQGATFEPAFDDVFHRSVVEHGKHIASNLEWDPVHRGNHYLADIVGLLFVASYLPTTSESNGWLMLSKSELLKEIDRQFLDDGGNIEGSTHYHRLSLEMATWGVSLGKLTAPAKLTLAEQFLTAVTRNDRAIPQIGDNDSGYFLNLDPIKPEWTRVNVSPPTPLIEKEGAWEIFKNARSQAKGNDIEIQEFQLPDADYVRGLVRLGFPEFGIYVFKSKRLYLSVRCGVIGRNGDMGGHAHNDQLSITLNIDGRDVVVDPGTYVYTSLPEKRNQYRSVQAHNAPHWAGKEPGRLDLGLFRLDDKARAECLYFGPDGFLGVHHGFEVPVYRRIEFSPEKITVTDVFESNGQRPVAAPQEKIPFSLAYGQRETESG